MHPLRLEAGRGEAGMAEAGRLVATMPAVPERSPARPPSELTDAQADVWRDVTSSMRPDWLIRGAYRILIEYCRHVCRARLLEAQIAHFETEWMGVEGGLERFDKMLSMAERESRAALACARSLRLTPQAQMHPLAAGRRVVEGEPKPMPWEGYGLPRSPLEA